MVAHSWCVCQTYMYIIYIYIYLSSGLTGKGSWFIQVQGVEWLGGCGDNCGNWKGGGCVGKQNSKHVCSYGKSVTLLTPSVASTHTIDVYIPVHTHTKMHV